MKINYILTAFSPAMFGEKATAHIRIIPTQEAIEMTDEHTKVMATRPTHEALARNVFGTVARETVRYAQLEPGVGAIFLHYRGPPMGPDGQVPIGAMITTYLIETESYNEAT